MKELSIEEKACDKAIKVIKDNLGALNEIVETGAEVVNIQSIQNCFYKAFPELKESEDERIRKEILDYIDKATGCKRWVAWLEKQEDKDSQVKLPTFTFDDILALQCCMETVKKVQEDKDLYEKLNDLHGRVYDAYHLEKQGKPVEINLSEFDSQLNKLLKQFETLPKEELINSLSFYLNVVKNDYLSDNVEPTDYNSIDPHFGEPVDKVEPKFKVGDWCIDNEDGLIFQIVKVLDKTYRYRTNEGKEYSCSHYTLELDARFWNMSDAKEGDVLVDSLGNVCIYQEPSTKLMYHSHCYGNHKFFIPTVGSHGIVCSYPATKEQRDQLEKAMADAGYVFDFEKKELKEIENEEYDGEDYGIDSLWHAKNILEKTLGKVDGYQTDDGILDHKCAISFIDKLYKQKPAEWSEEDESNFQGIIDELKANKHHAPDSDLPTYDRFLSWFKSLKERYVWKPSD